MQSVRQHRYIYYLGDEGCKRMKKRNWLESSISKLGCMSKTGIIKLSDYGEKLLKSARGDVLEVGVGAGANFPFYDRDQVKVTAADFSEEMIGIARKVAVKHGIEAEFVVEDVEKLSFPKNSFDTVVSTLSLCSYFDPVKVLNQMNRWCRKGGQILLLEHGSSSYFSISLLQKVLNPLAHTISGCHYNRDIMRIIDQWIFRSKIERYWLNIIHLVGQSRDRDVYSYNCAAMVARFKHYNRIVQN